MVNAKEKFKHSHFATPIPLLVVYTTVVLVAHSQAQSGFTSLDCGLAKNSSYKEETTGINYVSDSPFIGTGESKSISSEYKVNRQQNAKTVRSFPEGIRNCYQISTRKGTKYLIRATFLYGNYDGKNVTPQFDLHFGANLWDTVKIDDSSSDVIKEIIHLASRSYVKVCLVNTGSGTPFISALELRALKNTTYELQSGMSLALLVRLDAGSTSNLTYRYPSDIFDRLWSPFLPPNDWKVLTTSATVDPEGHIDFQPPQDVMRTAATPNNASSPLQFNLEAPDTNTGYYMYIHLAELQELKANEFRAFNINVDGRLLHGPVTPSYLSSTTIYTDFLAFTGRLNYSFTLEKIENSTLPPILNAIEVYSLLDLSQPETDQDDVAAMMNIKSIYGVKRNWDGDPCVPVTYLWTGLNCSNDGSNPPRITSLDLSSSGLAGKISTYIANLSMLESLDLSNNSFTGSVPSFLSQLRNLRVLNLEKNKLTGLVPAELIERSNDGSLSLSVEENQDLCASSQCRKKKNNNLVIPVASSVGGLLLVLLIAAIFLGVKHKKKKVLGNAESNNHKDPFMSRKRQFTYSEITKITNNFERVLGKGGFGTVYHGILDDGTQVAVKTICLPPPNQGNHAQSQEEAKRKKEHAEQQYQQFQAEVKLLMTVYHGNLTSLVGYCKQGTNMALMYEYMANGDLESHLKAKQGNVLSWETRLKIAIDAAQGLEYLHHGCKPPIIHRDVKPANILLTKNFRAKLADFGLSKFFPTDDGTHVTTVHIAGTPGYLDPDLTNNSWLNEKSDVFSFGVVLLQIITGRPAISRTDQDGSIDRTHISQWVSSILDYGNVETIADSKWQGNFEITSVFKAVKIAMSCVSLTAISRPNMTKVVTDLRECLALEQDRKNNYTLVTKPTYSNHDVL